MTVKNSNLSIMRSCEKFIRMVAFLLWVFKRKTHEKGSI